MGRHRRRATAVSVTVVTAAVVLAGCGRLETRRHAFPDSVYEPTAIAAAPATVPTANPGATAESGKPEAVAPGEPFADLTAAQLLKKAADAADGVRTVRVVADIQVDGEDLGFDIRYNRDSGDLVGAAEFEGRTVEILRRGDDAWYKADAAYWLSSGVPADDARRLAGKYLHVPSTHQAFDGFDEFADLADPSAFLGSITKPRRQAAVVREGALQIPVQGNSGGDRTTVYLSVDHGLVPVRIAESATDSTLEYRDLDKPVVVPVPPPSEVVDIEELSDDVRLPMA